MKTLIIKIKAIIENIFEYIGFHYIGYKVYIDINAKEIRAIKDELKALKNSRIVENFNIQFDDINNRLDNYKDSVKMLRGDIKANKNNINQLTHEAKSYIDDDKLQERFYDFKHQHITPLEDVQYHNDNTIFNEVATLKEYIKSVEKLVNELCELNQLKGENNND